MSKLKSGGKSRTAHPRERKKQSKGDPREGEKKKVGGVFRMEIET